MFRDWAGLPTAGADLTGKEDEVTDSAGGEVFGIVGVGNMGGAIARSALRAGLRLVAHDVRPEAVDELVALGATAAPSVAAVVGAARVVALVVVSDEQVREVGRAAIEAAEPGTVLVVHSTVRPSTVVELAAAGGERGVAVVDAAVNGGNEKAALGTLTVMIGGEDAAVRTAWPLFEAIGAHLFHIGPVGSGVVAKLVNNLMAIGGYALQLEAMQLAAAYGLDEDTVTTMVTVSQGDSRGIRTWGRHDRKRRARMAEGTVWYERMGRDLEEAVIAGGAHGVIMPLTAVAAEALPHKLRQRDRDLEQRPPSPPIPRCTACDQELAAPFRAAGHHPECADGQPAS
jgi:3-hydroxyisobutyrate dehydrogenase